MGFEQFRKSSTNFELDLERSIHRRKEKIQMVVFALTWFMVGLITNLICIMATGKVYWLAIMLIFCFGYFSPLFIFNYLKIKNFFKNNIN